jgi:lauroyl/myristoyl acyltransferase
VAGYRKAVVKENLAGAFPDQSEREVTVLAKKFYRQFAQVGLEIARARYMDETDFRERVEILNPELIAECSGGMRQSVIILTIHQGNAPVSHHSHHSPGKLGVDASRAGDNPGGSPGSSVQATAQSGGRPVYARGTQSFRFAPRGHQ